MFSKRTRGKNFTEQEEHALLDLVLLNKDILQDKTKDAATWRRKAETWERLTMEFQAQTGTDRSCAALREKYDNMKKNLRNKYRGVKHFKRQAEHHSAVSSWYQSSTTSQDNADHTGITGSPLENQFDSDGNSQLLSAAKEENSSISLQNSDNSQLLQFFKENIDDIEEIESVDYSQRWKRRILETCSSPEQPMVKTSTRVEEEQVELFRLQQQYYKDQNVRAAEKHKYEVERELIELQTARIKNQLIEMEIELKREELAKLRQRSLTETNFTNG
ncbi:uncharacterized protein LOC120449082 isoform X1 [Drosophila santomea]|uniref:uncharacterized protein LOC120449082 isoform X1 n=1 Tax=Drosophila santomea TaxID=129105 RepID=UPI001953D161|nr:uncharacterized protein LOC120449082 isoform X1 [Drosophila santomea]